jgi:CRP-like cAMP-binding protein
METNMPTVRATVDLLQQIPIFASLTEDELRQIIQSPDNGIVSYKPLEPIIHEDEIGDCMYIVLEGAVDVRIKAVAGREITIATLKAGEFFGEQALLPGATGKRNAGVRALQSSRLFKITKKDVVLGISQQEDLSGALDDLNSLGDDERVKMLIRSVRLFRSLSRKDLDRIGTWTEVVAADAGEIIVREEEQGDFMYVV